MADDLVTITVDGRALQARKGAMLMDVTDDAGIYVPRFCYHKKLSVAANCRMCLVEVEKAPKPMPACATPVMDGMVVHTKSPKAVDAQKSTMEFLLINHPLDCPICDQGGECELQDLAMGYGSDVSRYAERKRVVRDKNIGPLIQTDMTRCIHCTRCVRFGEEVAGLRELGATGRGEHMEIGTYIEKSVESELSGNVIDLCPVGALTSKPYRYSARAWELRQFDGVAPHDCLGSNLYLHTKGQVVKRVVPRENESINETWLSDRDRFSYEGLRAEDRLTAPRIKENGQWRTLPWETALEAAVTRLRGAAQSPGRVGTLVSPAATVEEAYLAQRLTRGLGSSHVDHRLRQLDFSGQDHAPLYPWLGQTLADIEAADAVLIIGGDPRLDQPLVHHRIRKAAARGARVVFLNSRSVSVNFDGATQLVVLPSSMPFALAGVTRALKDAKADAGDWDQAFAHVRPTEQEQAVAAMLAGAARASILIGIHAHGHPNFDLLCGCAAQIGRLTGGRFGYLTEGPNAAGCWLAGALPHRLAGGAADPLPGMHAGDMLANALAGYLLVGVEPDLDCFNGEAARAALARAESVVALTSYMSPVLAAVADIVLPIAGFAENEGTYVNALGLAQSFNAAVKPAGDARPAWKVLRMLGHTLGLEGFGFSSVGAVRDAVTAAGEQRSRIPDDPGRPLAAFPANGSKSGIERTWSMPLYATDAVVRRAPGLQQTGLAGDSAVRVHPNLLRRLHLADGQAVRVAQNGVAVDTIVIADANVAEGAAHLYAAQSALVPLGAMAGEVTITPRAAGEAG